MLTREENDRLCRVGPNDPMGKLFRRYWLPICTSDRLPEPGCAPLAERLLGENFVVFRSRDGKVGVLDEFCIHRNASLALGRVEDCGIRCIYHGWKFGTDGEVLEIMNNPSNRRAWTHSVGAGAGSTDPKAGTRRARSSAAGPATSAVADGPSSDARWRSPSTNGP